MHAEAYNAVGSMVEAAKKQGCLLAATAWRGLDVGGQDVNGTARDHFQSIRWDSLDLHDQEATFVADARRHSPYSQQRYDVVLCTEVLEHVRWWPLVVRTCFDMAKHGGLVFITAAADPRNPHSAQGLASKPLDEFYENVNPDELRALVEDVFKPRHVEHAYRQSPGDVYLWAQK